MDFKIGDEIEEVDENTEKKPKKISIIIIVVISLVIGLTVFFVSMLFLEELIRKKKIQL